MQMALRQVLQAATAATLLMVAGQPLQAGPGRMETTLNGAWETAPAVSLETPPATITAWRAFQVPGGIPSIRGDRSWFRRTFSVPADWAGQRVFIVYDGVKFASRHWVNGTFVGERVRGYDLFRLEITGAVRFGADHGLLLGCSDWQGTFSAPLNLANVPIGDTAREVPRDLGLTPIGGVFYEYGPWADVALLTVPPVHLADVILRTSVRQHKLYVEASVANLADSAQTVQLAGAVAEAPEIVLPARPLQVPPGPPVSVSWTIPWPNPKLWDFEQPNLYHLQLTLTAPGQADDRRSVRFGFREFRCDGPRFRLNGTPLVLRSSAMWPLPETTREAAAERLRKLKITNVICFRTHAQPWRQHWYDAAGEVGMLMIPEAPVFNDDTYYRLADPRFWENYAAEIASMVGRLRNSPAVIAYSLENEFFGPLLNDKSPAKAELVKLGEQVRRLDPTRPFMYESDGDPTGVADIEGVHYPQELGEAHLYPADAYWMDQPKPLNYMFLNGAETWRWERRKPLYIGEYLWCPSPSPALYSILFGDDAYRDYPRYAQRAIGMAWSLRTRAYRFYRVSGLCPWTCAGGNLDPATDAMAAAQAEAMRPLAAFVKEYTTRFYGGQTVRRTLLVINDTLRGGTVRVEWSFTPERGSAPQGSLSCALQPTGLEVATFEFTPPAVTQVTAAELRVRATLTGTPDFEERLPCRVFPPLRLPAPAAALGLLARPDDPAAQRLAAHGVTTVPVPSLAAIPAGVRVLLIGRNALPAVAAGGKPVLRVGAGADPYQGLIAFIAGGGRVLLLAQTEPHVPLGPVRFSPRQATFTFPLAPHHPALAGLSSEDLRFWGPDHLVADALFSRASSGLRSLLVSGAESGLEYSALAEGDLGAGKLVVCGLRLLEALETEPAAGLLLGNLLQYLERWQPTSGGCAAVSADADLAKLLNSLDIDVPVYPTLAALPPGPWRTLLLGADSTGATLQAAQARLGTAGSTVWWHTPERESFNAWAAEHGHGLRLAAAAGPLRLRDGDPFVDGLARADLCWVGEAAPGAPDWAQRGAATDIIAEALEVGAGAQSRLSYSASVEAEELEFEAVAFNAVRPGVLCLANPGSAWAAIQCDQAGPYLLRVHARGGPALDEWPILLATLDGTEISRLTIGSTSLEPCQLPLALNAGDHRLELRFINDYCDAGKADRNCFLDRIEIRPQAPGG